MDTFTVRVEFTDRSRNEDGSYRTYHATVEVLADSETEATQVASQMAHAIRADLDPMILGARVTDVVV